MYVHIKIYTTKLQFCICNRIKIGYNFSMKIKDIVTKELEKNQMKQSVFKEEINELPTGTLVRVKGKSNVYVYLKHREGTSVVSKYVGKENDMIVSKIEMDIRRRKALELKLKELQEEAETMLKMLKV